jgi:hypothetical protein
MRSTVLCAFLVVVMVSWAAAQEAATAPAPDLSARLEDTLARLDAAQRRIDELEARVGALEGSVGAASRDVGSLSGQMKAIEEKARGPAAPAQDAVKITPYGQIKVDAAVNNSATNSADDPTYVIQEKANFGNDRNFALTVRQTQFGLNIQTPDVAGGKSRGKVEIDFYAPAAAEIKPEPRLRYAYWELVYPEWSVLVGQAIDVMSPIYPVTLNRPHLDQSGNIGYRRPMVKYQRTFTIGGDSLQTELALARGSASPASSSVLDDAASDAGWPLVEARAGISIPTALKRPIVFGISGHVGQEEYDRVTLDAGPPASLKTVSGNGNEFMTYSGNLDWKAPLAENWDVAGEFFAGRNLDDFVGGIGQGVNNAANQGATKFASALNKPIDAIGGWTQITYRPVKKWSLSVGAGIDDPDNADLSGAINRARNLTCFANAIYSATSNLSVGLETAYMDTDYLTGASGDNVRIQSSLIYKF